MTDGITLDAAALDLLYDSLRWLPEKERSRFVPLIAQARAALSLRDELSACERERDEATQKEADRWGARLDFFHVEFGADGSGCDSGDPLDVIKSEARQVITRLTDERDEARADERARADREWCIAILAEGTDAVEAITRRLNTARDAAIRARGKK